MEGGSYQKTVLDNGITLVTEAIPHLRSATVGVWIKYGSVDDPPEAVGVSHFIEHLLFKGTEKRTAGQIAQEIDLLGGQIDAFTGRESTCYYARVLDQHLEQAMDLLMDIIFHAQIRPDDIELERQVVLEEIKEDNPEEQVHDLFTEQIWKGHPLGRPICGTSETIKSLGRERIIDFYRSVYQPPNILVAAAGNVKHQNMIRQLKLTPGHASSEKKDGRAPNPALITSHTLNKHRELEEVHICLGTKGVEQTNPTRFASYLLNTVLGSGISSRLFQEIREKRGLAYSIYSFTDHYRDSGLLAVYGATSPASYQEVISLIEQEFDNIKTSGISAQELEQAKQQLNINLLLSLESSMNRMNNLARNELYFQRQITPQETTENIDRVTTEDIIELAQEIFRPKYLNLAVLSPPPAG